MSRRGGAALGDLFDGLRPSDESAETLAEGATVLRGFARPEAVTLMETLQAVLAEAWVRHMVTPGGFRMSVAMSNCGRAGWVTDRSGYRYDPIDPMTGRPWPPMPAAFRSLAARAAAAADPLASSPTRASSTATSPRRGFRFIRTGTSGTSAHPSCRSRSGCRRYSCSADCAGATGHARSGSRAATLQSGVAPRGLPSTASSLSPMATTR